MMELITKDDLRRLATGYGGYVEHRTAAQEALDAAGADTFDRDTTCEVKIEKVVYEAAATRARHLGMKLAPVGRAILFGAAVLAEPDPDYNPAEGRPRLRRHGGQPMFVWRFLVPEVAYAVAMEVITASNTTVTAVVEDGLREYALSGTLPLV